MNLSILNLNHPMAAARIVRKEKYAFPGGYELLLILDDGACLCSDCVTENYSLISSSHRSKCNDGWRPVGYDSMGNYDEPEQCQNCWRLIGQV